MKFFIIFLILFFSACSQKSLQDDYTLFQKKTSQTQKNSSKIETSDSLELTPPQELNITYSSKIVPNDMLSIDIYNMHQKSNIMISEKGNSLPDNTYLVYPDGTIILPLLNSVDVAGLTIKELTNELTKRYRKFLNLPYVKANVKNHKIFVLGEVVKRGVIPIEGETISIIEAIAKSGGLTDHAIRSHIRVISEEHGKYVLRTLNLNKFSTLNSHQLMLKHNSIVYVEPKGTKAVRVAINDYLPIMQAISSVLGTFLTIDYLKK